MGPRQLYITERNPGSTVVEVVVVVVFGVSCGNSKNSSSNRRDINTSCRRRPLARHREKRLTAKNTHTHSLILSLSLSLPLSLFVYISVYTYMHVCLYTHMHV